MNPEIIRAIELGAMNALRLYVALLTAPYHISKAFVMRPMGKPFRWTWENRLQPCSGGDQASPEECRDLVDAILESRKR